MTTIAVAAIVVPALTAFLIGYWHRKQLRQIEAYRRDPSVGLTPPPSALWRFVTSRWRLLLMTGWPVFAIGWQFYEKAPLNLVAVFTMASNVTMFGVGLVFELLEGLRRITERHVAVTERVIETVRSLAQPPSSGGP